MSFSVLYVRVSSLDQNTSRQRINENQFDKLIEDRCSGSIPLFQRNGGLELKKLIEMNLVSSISVTSLDRICRNLIDLLDFLNYTAERKIPVHFLSQGLKTLDEGGKENPIAKMTISILGIVAELERVHIRERQREGIELAKLKGDVFLGRKPGTKEDPLKFLSKPRNQKAMNLIKKGYKNIEVARIVGINVNTVSKVKKVMASLE